LLILEIQNSKFKINYSARLVARGVRHQGICKFEISPQKERRNGEAIPPLFLWGYYFFASPQTL
jgi:hypothetical protein